jgi:Fe-S cluster biogenesis protein NfuA
MGIQLRFVNDTDDNSNFIEVIGCHQEETVSIYIESEGVCLSCELYAGTTQALIKELQKQLNEANSGGTNEE